MNRFNWTYLADRGKQHHVGLMHGAQSGHLLVYCDSKILLIDFKVLEDKTYTFFIDEQLCEISIERQGDQFLYGFEINKKADTPRNRLRKKIEHRHFKQSMAFLAVVIALVVGFSYFMTTRKSSEKDFYEAQLENSGKEGKAKILKVSPSEITYFYVVNGTSYSGGVKSDDASIIVVENGMPLEEGDEFVVTYAPINPYLNEIDYNRPTPQQIKLYQERAIRQHLNLNPQTDSLQTVCLVNVALEKKGIAGLADIYFQSASPSDNRRNNRDSYLRMVRDLPFQQLLSERCLN